MSRDILKSKDTFCKWHPGPTGLLLREIPKTLPNWPHPASVDYHPVLQALPVLPGVINASDWTPAQKA